MKSGSRGGSESERPESGGKTSERGGKQLEGVPGKREKEDRDGFLSEGQKGA